MYSDGSSGSIPPSGPAASRLTSRPLFPLQTDRAVECDSVQPGEKLGVALEGVERLVSVQEGILNDIRGILGVDPQPDDGVVKPCLVSGYQFTEGVPSAAQAFRDEPAIVVAHNLLPCSTGFRRGSSRIHSGTQPRT